MLNQSFSSSQARFLNKTKTIDQLKALARKARKQDKNIISIILFGSLVNNTFTPRSDADLLIILTDSNHRFMDRIPQFLPLFIEAPIPVDVFPYTEAESTLVPLAKKAKREGLLLA